MKISPIHIFVLIMLGLISSFCIFYLGARFGPEMFWGINLADIERNSLLPKEASDEELKALLSEEFPEMNFQDVLAGKTVKEEITGEVQEEIQKEGQKEVKEIKKIIEEVKIKEEVEEKVVSVPKNEPKVEVKEEVIPAQIGRRAPETGGGRAADPRAGTLEAPEARREKEEVMKEETKKIAAVVSPAPVEEALSPPSHFSFSLQVGSFQDLQQAESIRDQYQARGYSATIRNFEISDKGTWYRVYVGHYSSREAADKARSEVVAKYKGAPLVIQNQ